MDNSAPNSADVAGRRHRHWQVKIALPAGHGEKVQKNGDVAQMVRAVDS